MKSLLSKLPWFQILLSIFVIATVALAVTDNRAAKADSDIEPRTVQTTDKQPETTITPILEAAVKTPPPTLPEETSTPIPLTDDRECAEEIVEEPKRENILYYIMDSGYRYDCEVDYQDYLWAKCKEYGIEAYYELMLAMIYHESKFDPSVVSGTNDYGLMQINSCNHNWLKETLGITDFLNPYDSIDAGVYIMSGYLLKYNDIHMALMCYNMGEGGAKRCGQSSSTYSREVVADMDKLQLLEE